MDQLAGEPDNFPSTSSLTQQRHGGRFVKQGGGRRRGDGAAGRQKELQCGYCKMKSTDAHFFSTVTEGPLGGWYGPNGAPIPVSLHKYPGLSGSRICNGCKIANVADQGLLCQVPHPLSSAAASLFSPRGAATSGSLPPTPVTLPHLSILLPADPTSVFAAISPASGHSLLSSGQASPAVQYGGVPSNAPNPPLLTSVSAALHWHSVHDKDVILGGPPRQRRNSLTGEGPAWGSPLEGLPHLLEESRVSSNDSVVSACKVPACENG